MLLHPHERLNFDAIQGRVEQCESLVHSIFGDVALQQQEIQWKNIILDTSTDKHHIMLLDHQMLWQLQQVVHVAASDITPLNRVKLIYHAHKP